MNWQFRDVKGRLSALGWRLLPGGVTALGVALLLRLGAWDSLESIGYTTLFKIRGPIPPSNQVVIIGIDDPSLKELGSFPLPRRYYAQLLEQLTKAEPSVVAIDLLLSDPDPEDPLLAQAIAQQGRVVLAQGWNSTGTALLPSAVLRDKAIAIGHILNRPSADGITRYITPQIQDVSALGIAAIQSYRLVQGTVTLPPLYRNLWINWLGPARQIPEYSLAAVLKGQVPPQTFHNKIVLIGVTAAGLDSLRTPYNRNPPASGVHLHATVISNLLQHNALHLLPSPWLLAIVLLGGPGLSAFLMARPPRQQTLTWLGCCIGWFTLAIATFQAGYWIPVAFPIILFSLTTAATELYERLRLNARLQQEIEQIWQTYCQDLLIWATAPETARLESTAPISRLEPNHTVSACSESQPIVKLTQLAKQFGRSQSAHAAIARSLSIGLLAADWDGVVWFCNPLAAEWLHVHMGAQIQPYVVPEWLSQSEWETDLQQLHDAKMASRELQRGDRWFEITLEPLFYQPPSAVQEPIETPVPTGLLLLLEDITPRKQAEAEVHRAMEQEKELYELKARFITTASHEFRTPLTIILGSAELLENYGHRWTDEKKHDHLHRIQHAVQHMMELLNDVLLLSRAESGQFKFSPHLLNLNLFCTDLVQQLGTVTNQSHRLNLVMQNLPPQVRMDEKLLRHIFSNLLSNALKYSPTHSPVEFIITCDNNTATFHVIDRGIGIPPENVQHLFDPFYRADNVGNIAGTGLGLAIAKEAITLHNGHIDLHSEVNVGTHITVTLPIGHVY
ncbi:MAG TPA: CHASE2 domain-containing protein [Crinalium sp.]|jgi:signal transduction histidine kinase